MQSPLQFLTSSAQKTVMCTGFARLTSLLLSLSFNISIPFTLMHSSERALWHAVFLHQIKTCSQAFSAAVQQFYSKTVQFHWVSFKIFNTQTGRVGERQGEKRGGYKVCTVGGVRGRYREQIWRLTEVQKDRERWKVKLPGVCQQHVTGVGVIILLALRAVSLSLSLSPSSAVMNVWSVYKKFVRKRSLFSQLFFFSAISVSLSLSDLQFVTFLVSPTC